MKRWRHRIHVATDGSAPTSERHQSWRNQSRGRNKMKIFGNRIGVMRCTTIRNHWISMLLLRSIVASIGKETFAWYPTVPFWFFIVAIVLVIAIDVFMPMMLSYQNALLHSKDETDTKSNLRRLICLFLVVLFALLFRCFCRILNVRWRSEQQSNLTRVSK